MTYDFSNTSSSYNLYSSHKKRLHARMIVQQAHSISRWSNSIV